LRDVRPVEVVEKAEEPRRSGALSVDGAGAELRDDRADRRQLTRWN
jgi:hypothetical protein